MGFCTLWLWHVTLSLPVSISILAFLSLQFHYDFPTALLSKLEEKIAEVPIESKDLGFTKEGPYIYQLLSELNITQQTANMLIGTIEKACELLEEGTSMGQPPLTAKIFLLSSIFEFFKYLLCVYWYAFPWSCFLKKSFFKRALLWALPII